MNDDDDDSNSNMDYTKVHKVHEPKQINSNLDLKSWHVVHMISYSSAFSSAFFQQKVIQQNSCVKIDKPFSIQEIKVTHIQIDLEPIERLLS